MFSAIARASRRHQPKLLSSAVGATRQAVVSNVRYLSTPADPETFKPQPPAAITDDMAEGIQDTTLFYLRNGVARQRLLALANEKETPLVTKWPRMLEIYLTTQVLVVSGLGFSGNEQGLQEYTQMLAQYMSTCDNEIKETYQKVGKETWRELLCTAFELDPDEINEISIVDARNIMHKVCSKMQEPAVLMKIQKECSKVEAGPEIEKEFAYKHQILQEVIINDVYLGGSPSITEESGFGSGQKGYARLQAVMADYEGDPLIQQYMVAATERMFEAAALDPNAMAGAGSMRLPQSS